jgi:hypothetical protein
LALISVLLPIIALPWISFWPIPVAWFDTLPVTLHDLALRAAIFLPSVLAVSD